MGGVGTAIIASAVIGAASSAYQAKEQKKAAEADANRRRQEAEAQKAEADRIARETKPEEESLGEVNFGAESDSFSTGSTQEFLVPKTGSLGKGSSGRSGLGFKI